MPKKLQPKAAIIVIGDEILSGRTKDKNIGYIAEKLFEVGIKLDQVRIIGDNKKNIIKTVIKLSKRFDYVFTSGGIGPTHDDITSDSIASAFNVDLKLNTEALRRLENHYKDTGLKLNSSRIKMAIIPEGSELIDNPVSAAPGFKIKNVFVMAGVPKIMQAMLDSVINNLKKGPKIYSKALGCQLGEGTIAEGIEEIQNKFKSTQIGCYPFFKAGNFGVSIVVRSTNKDLLRVALDDIKKLILDLGSEPYEIID